MLALLAMTWPRSMSSRSMPRSRQPTLSPAWPESSSFLNISTPVTTTLRVSRMPIDLDLVADLDGAALDAPGRDGAAALDAEDVLDGHEEGLVDVALGGGDVGVDRVHELGDGRVGGVGGVVAGLEGLQGGAAHEGDVVAGEVVLGEQLADLELDELEQLGVVDHVDLVEEDDDVGHLDLAREEDVLARLGHGPVGGGHHEDGAVHLGGPGDHVLDVVGVAGAVDVGVVAGVGLVLDVGDGDGDAALTLLGGVVDRVEGAVLGLALEREVLRDGRRQARLAMVDVTDGADVDVGLVALELLLGHPSLVLSTSRAGTSDVPLDLRLLDQLVGDAGGELRVVRELHG